MFRRSLATLCVAYGVVVLGGCDDEDDPIAILGQGAQLRVVHASPDDPAVDVYAEGIATPLISDLAYGESSDYLQLDPGSYNVQLRAAGSAPSSAPAFETGALNIAEGATITAVAVGLLGSSDAADRFRVLPLSEDFAQPGSGQSAVRILHAGADAPSVAIDVAADGTPEISDFARFADSGVAGVPLPANSALRLAIWAGSPLQRVTTFTTPALPEGAELFVIATGLLDRLPREDDGFALLAVGPSGSIGLVRQDPIVYALHASPDAPSVDIYAGSTELVDDLQFGQLSAPIQVSPGSYALDFRANDDGPIAASAGTPALAAGQRYLAVASGFLGDASFTLIPALDDLSLDAVGAVLRVIHASPDAPAVDVGTVDGSDNVTALSDFSNLDFETISPAGGTDVPAANLELGIAVAGTTPAVATFSVTTVPGLRAFVVAAGSLDGNGESFRLLLVDTTAAPWALASVLPN